MKFLENNKIMYSLIAIVFIACSILLIGLFAFVKQGNLFTNKLSVDKVVSEKLDNKEYITLSLNKLSSIVKKSLTTKDDSLNKERASLSTDILYISEDELNKKYKDIKKEDVIFTKVWVNSGYWDKELRNGGYWRNEWVGKKGVCHKWFEEPELTWLCEHHEWMDVYEDTWISTTHYADVWVDTSGYRDAFIIDNKLYLYEKEKEPTDIFFN